jgi:transcription initiation factor IIE alpha subunit
MSKAKLSEVIECFEEHGELTLPELCEEIGSSSKSARMAIKKLVEADLLEVVPPVPTKVWDHKDPIEATQYRLTTHGRV